MTEPRLKLSPPWTIYVKMLTALFDGDPEIAINTSAKDTKITIATNNGDKASALVHLLPDTVPFGKVTLSIAVDGPFTNRAFVTNEELLNTAFCGNPALSYIRAIDGIVASFTYVVFKNCVIQFFADNLDDIHGLTSTLYEDIAREVLVDIPGVVYNTDIEQKILGMPKEWP